MFTINKGAKFNTFYEYTVCCNETLRIDLKTDADNWNQMRCVRNTCWNVYCVL